MIPVKHDFKLPTGVSATRRAPDVVTYEANMRASLPLFVWTPYVTAGCGAMTLLKSTEPDRLVQVQSPQTAFAINFGGGATFPFNERWGIRGDFREFAMLPGANAQSLSPSSAANAIWTERAAVGLSYSF